ncbi:MAG: Acetyl-CoA carboxylase biotin carboxyl carrier protein subunit [candidate division TM6 bacterium GW2011_GWF2_37_49]|nr:MAG: Acetyl-CoA carboxylase biotin carboxyl carrier protein subunit [candidate division TM6 bacterium GW2011_GWF2_37_49]
MEIKEFLIDNKKYSVKILKQYKNLLELKIGQKQVLVKVIKFDEAQNTVYLQINGQPKKMCMPSIKNKDQIIIDLLNSGPQLTLQKIKPKTIPALVGENFPCALNESVKFYGAEKLSLKSPLTGRITKIFVQNGEQVNKNKPVLAIESMKMENEIRVPFDAFVKSILISEGNLIQQDQVLITFEKKGEANAGDVSKQ